jgi:hypothetical protein
MKRPGREADNSATSNTEVKNEWSFTSFSFVSGVHEENLMAYHSLKEVYSLSFYGVYLSS